jgi:hypothetical protein
LLIGKTQKTLRPGRSRGELAKDENGLRKGAGVGCVDPELLSIEDLDGALPFFRVLCEREWGF